MSFCSPIFVNVWVKSGLTHHCPRPSYSAKPIRWRVLIRRARSCLRQSCRGGTGLRKSSVSPSRARSIILSKSVLCWASIVRASLVRFSSSLCGPSSKLAISCARSLIPHVADPYRNDQQPPNRASFQDRFPSGRLALWCKPLGLPFALRLPAKPQSENDGGHLCTANENSPRLRHAKASRKACRRACTRHSFDRGLNDNAAVKTALNGSTWSVAIAA